MTRKTSECYTAIFEFIEEKLFKLKPKEFMTDYEDGMRLAIKKRWPTATIRGCWFHLARAVERRYRKLGLSRLKGGKIIKRMLMSLPLLPADEIEEGFESVIKYSKKKRLYKHFSRLFSYFSRYWMNQVTYITALKMILNI